jgi:hypothetical protein
MNRINERNIAKERKGDRGTNGINKTWNKSVKKFKKKYFPGKLSKRMR